MLLADEMRRERIRIRDTGEIIPRIYLYIYFRGEGERGNSKKAKRNKMAVCWKHIHEPTNPLSKVSDSMAR